MRNVEVELDTVVDSRFEISFFLECEYFECNAPWIPEDGVGEGSFNVERGESLMAAVQRGARLEVRLSRPPDGSGLFRRPDGDVSLECLTALIKGTSRPVYELHLNNPCVAEVYADTGDLKVDPSHVYIYIETLSDVKTLQRSPGIIKRLLGRY